MVDEKVILDILKPLDNIKLDEQETEQAIKRIKQRLINLGILEPTTR